MPPNVVYNLLEQKMGKKSKLLASCVCIVDAIGNLKFYFEPSDVGSVDLEFMKNLHPPALPG